MGFDVVEKFCWRFVVVGEDAWTMCVVFVYEIDKLYSISTGDEDGGRSRELEKGLDLGD
jgi:hypothetical protein